MKNILVVSFFYRPFSKVGAKRTNYLVDFLASKNYKILLFKAADKYYGPDINEKKRKINPKINIKNIKIGKTSKWKRVNWLKFYFSFKNDVYAIWSE